MLNRGRLSDLSDTFVSALPIVSVAHYQSLPVSVTRYHGVIAGPSFRSGSSPFLMARFAVHVIDLAVVSPLGCCDSVGVMDEYYHDRLTSQPQIGYLWNIISELQKMAE